jgi:hypothetical protein
MLPLSTGAMKKLMTTTHCYYPTTRGDTRTRRSSSVLRSSLATAKELVAFEDYLAELLLFLHAHTGAIKALFPP